MPRIDFTLTALRRGAHPATGEDPGEFLSADPSHAAGLTPIGLHGKTPPPGAKSSMRRWREGEMVYVLAGELTLAEDTGEAVLRAGDAAAGTPNAHRLENRSGAEARFPTAGKRGASDMTHTPDHDLIPASDGPRQVRRRGDGTLVREG